ncbi:hypothetical protein EX30DRAFT_68531 [Ascodesmis nigricans]|uniref:Uncharacterized protein n=1 Tax=Ascodesmis nigricans TaxID=341454 RepID=A0A4S2MU32_9PEZI|nr:hypothetical protein EX30DRAFT_68531 [Ascodesmis nigricans]
MPWVSKEPLPARPVFYSCCLLFTQCFPFKHSRRLGFITAVTVVVVVVSLFNEHPLGSLLHHPYSIISLSSSPPGIPPTPPNNPILLALHSTQPNLKMISLSSFASSLPTPSIRVPSLPSLPTIPPLSLPTFSLPAALQRPAPPPSTQLLTTLTRYLLLYPSLLLLALIFALSFSSYLLSALHDYDTHVEKSRLKPQHFDLENTVKPPVVKEGVVERNPRTPPPAPPSVAMKMVVGELVGKQRREAHGRMG